MGQSEKIIAGHRMRASGGRLGWRFALMLAACLIGPGQPRSAPQLQGVAPRPQNRPETRTRGAKCENSPGLGGSLGLGKNQD